MAKSSWRGDKGEEKCSQVTPVLSACRKPLCRVLIFSDSLRARCSHSSAGAYRLLPPQTLNWRRTVAGPAPKQAAEPGRTGAILVSQFGPVKIHSYLSPADGLQVNTQMIEGPNAVVIFDGQLLLPYADEVASYVQTLGKPIDRIILSHAHTDHWGGLQVLTERFTNARVFALDGIADQVRARGPARLDGLRRTYGDRVATKVTVPTETITEGPHHRIDRVTYDFRRFVDAESDLQLAVLLPEQKVLMAFDLVFSPNQHAFTGGNHFDHWLIVLESLKALQGYDRIIIGHDTPVDRFAIDSTMTYVKRAKEIHAASADAKTYSENLKAAFPNLQMARFVDLSASYLYAAPH